MGEHGKDGKYQPNELKHSIYDSKPSIAKDCTLTAGWPGCLGVRLFVTMPKWPQTQENDCRLRPSDQIHGKTRPDQIKPDHHNIYT